MRLSQAENNISATYIGMSQLVEALAATPAAAASAAMSSIYNLSAGGFDLQQKLVDLIPKVDMKKMMMNMASSIESAMLAELDSITSAVMGSLEAILDAATQALEDATQALSDAVDSAADAVSSLNSSLNALEAANKFGDKVAIATAQSAHDAAKLAADTAQSAVDSATNTLKSAQDVMDSFSEADLSKYGFMKGQSDLAKCKSLSSHLS